VRYPMRSVSWRAVLTWTVAATLILALALALIVAGQHRQIVALRGQAAQDRGAAQAAAATTDRRLAGLENRVEGIESRLAALDKRSAEAFDPQAVAASALPSVFLVVAGDSLGSAFAVGQPASGRTRILTAYHVVESVWTAGRTTVRLERDGKNYSATIADVSPTHDVALLTIGGKVGGITAASGKPRSGEQILVVGAPLGLADTITTGVVSAVRARVGGPGTMIQIDAPINPGNSGGPVVNTRREVVGIADAKAQDAEGIGLAVPIQTACKAFDVC
jgi:putative serine protease PepD